MADVSHCCRRCRHPIASTFTGVSVVVAIVVIVSVVFVVVAGVIAVVAVAGAAWRGVARYGMA